METGVSVQVHMEQRSTLLPVANTIAAALVAEGISANAQFRNAAAKSDNPNAIRIVVGEKPQ